MGEGGGRLEELFQKYRLRRKEEEVRGRVEKEREELWRRTCRKLLQEVALPVFREFEEDVERWAKDVRVEDRTEWGWPQVSFAFQAQVLGPFLPSEVRISGAPDGFSVRTNFRHEGAHPVFEHFPGAELTRERVERRLYAFIETELEFTAQGRVQPFPPEQ